MIRAIIRRKFLLLVVALGLGILALVACGSDAATASPGNAPADQRGTSAGLADLVGSQIRADSLQQLISAAANSQASTNTGIWVNGRGQASGEPDLAILSLGVSAFAGTVAEARSNAASQMGRVIEVLKAQAIADRDIQTRSFNINPRYTTLQVTKCLTPDEFEGPMVELESISPDATESSLEVESITVPKTDVYVEEIAGERRPRSPECIVEREQMIVGFDVTNQLTVKVRDLDSVGGIIDEVVEAGGDLIRFRGVSFTIEDTEELQNQARALAIQDLMDKATQVAELTGVELGQVVFISETGGPSVSSTFISARVAFAESAAHTPILAGELHVVVNIQAAFDIVRPAS